VLADRVNYSWRLLATGVAFAAFGIGALILATAVIPIATFTSSDSHVRARRVQALMHASFKLFILILRAFGVIRLEVSNAERLAQCRGHIIVANHPTLLDIVLIMSLVPHAQCVVKHQLWRNPLLRQVVREAGYVRNDLEPDLLVAKCQEKLAAGSNLIIFPEGTRSVSGLKRRLQRGFAHIATLTEVDLQPLTITCNPMTLVKGQPWYEIPGRIPQFRIEVDKTILIKPFLDSYPRALATRKLVSHVESYFDEKLNHG
jgi:1-acyl-sn-glycerol-3-phosphate acyltransferase